jgi:hypothetical protein
VIFEDAESRARPHRADILLFLLKILPPMRPISAQPACEIRVFCDENILRVQCSDFFPDVQY